MYVTGNLICLFRAALPSVVVVVVVVAAAQTHKVALMFQQFKKQQRPFLHILLFFTCFYESLFKQGTEDMYTQYLGTYSYILEAAASFIVLLLATIRSLECMRMLGI